jgi:energy-coupling factor transport system ATP-binding protein
MSTSPAIDVRHVSFGYGTRRASELDLALDDVSLEVAPGEFVAVVGQTGSGKSTLARLLCGLEVPDSGAVSVLGIPTADKRGRRSLRGRVGYVMQRAERQLFADTIGDDIAFGPRNLGLSGEETSRRVAEAAELVGIGTETLARSPFELSGGQQRLCAIAGVIAMRPEVVVCDEPTAGLDPRGRRRVTEALSRLHGQGTTVVQVTHSMDGAARADAIVVLDQSRLLMAGTPSEVFSEEETLVRHGLGIPEALRCAHELETAGFADGASLGEPLTLEALADALAREAATWR